MVLSLPDRGDHGKARPAASRGGAEKTRPACIFLPVERDEGLYLLLLKDAADAVAGSGSLESALGAMVDLVASRLGFDVCSIYLSDDRGELVLRATHGLRRESIGKVRMKTSEGLTG